MRFDSIIIGGGLSGLFGGIALARKGRRVAIISSGKSALHFSSGSFELWNRGADALASLAESNPLHPYNKIGMESLDCYTKVAKDIFGRVGIPLFGGVESNHLRLSPLGALKPAWLTMEEYATFESKSEIAGRKILIVGIEGYMDFYPEFIAKGLESEGAKCRVKSIEVPELKGFRESATELRSVNMSRILQGDTLVSFAQRVAEACTDEELVLLPALFGINDRGVFDTLTSIIGRNVKMAPTASLSVAGIRAQKLLTEEFVRLGGCFMGGDTVVSAKFENNKILSVRTANHGNEDFEAEEFMLATGSFYSRGLVATESEVVEPIMGLDVEAPELRAEWTERDILAPQPFQRFGVKTDAQLHPYRNGTRVDNLWAVGSVLAGADAVSEGSGGGIAILTPIVAADYITNK